MVNLSFSMQRYFAQVNYKDVILTEDDVFHILKVMRCKVGDEIQVVDKNSHQTYLARVKELKPLKVEIVEPILENVELNKDVTLFFALAKSDKIEFVIQKATELGAKKVVLFQGKRSVVKFSNDDFNRKLNRFIAIAKEAAEQCHRQYYPEIIYITDIKNVENYLCDLNLFAYELEAGQVTNLDSDIQEAKSFSIIIGPEGGFDESEAELLKRLNFKPISLGKRILRCETAAVYALSVISYLLDK